HLFEELFDHGADPHDLRRLLDHVGQGFAAVLGLLLLRPAVGLRAGRLLTGDSDGSAVGSDHENLVVVRMRHGSILPFPPRGCPVTRGTRSAGYPDRAYREGNAECRYGASRLTSGPRVSAMAYDVARIRGLIPSLGDGWIHLDPRAGMQIPDVVSRTVSTAFRNSAASSTGRHLSSRRSAAILQEARVAVAELVGADPDGVVLGPSHAVLLAWLAEALSSRLGLGTGMVLSRLDDEANIAPWLRVASRYGAQVRWAEVEIETCELPTWQYEELITPT